MPEKSPIINVVKKASPAVVSVVVTKLFHKLRKDLPFDMFGPFGMQFPFLQKIRPDKKIKIGGGSGFIVSSDGMLLTNRHVVIDPEAEYTIVTTDDKKYEAKVLARDSIYDIAILKIKSKKKFPTIKLGDSSKLQLGQTAIAIGNALGEFQNTVSTGVVSGLSRYITAQDVMAHHAQRLRGLIQTDTAINPGNSGGPLLDIDGKAIGISAAMVFGAENIGFALPINHAKKDLADLKKYGKVRHPSLGIRHILLNADLKEMHKLPFDFGAMIIPEPLPGDTGVIKGSPAAKAGLKEKDILLECDGKKISTDNSLEEIIEKHKVGDVLKFKVYSGGKTKTLKVTLGSRS